MPQQQSKNKDEAVKTLPVQVVRLPIHPDGEPLSGEEIDELADHALVGAQYHIARAALYLADAAAITEYAGTGELVESLEEARRKVAGAPRWKTR